MCLFLECFFCGGRPYSSHVALLLDSNQLDWKYRYIELVIVSVNIHMQNGGLDIKASTRRWISYVLILRKQRAPTAHPYKFFLLNLHLFQVRNEIPFPCLDI